MYVTGALSADDRATVEALCAANPALQRELEAEKLLAAAVREGEQEMNPPVERALAAMNARIDAYEQKRGWLPGWLRDLAGQIDGFRPVFAVPLGAAAAFLLAVWIWPAGNDPAINNFNTATDPPGAVAIDGPALRIKLAPGADATVLNELVERFQLTIVGNADPAAVLTVTLAEGSSAQAVADAL